LIVGGFYSGVALQKRDCGKLVGSRSVGAGVMMAHTLR